MFRKVSLPSDVVRHIKGLGALVSTALVDDEWLAVGTGDCAVVDANGIILTFPWTDVESATWEGETRTLTLQWVDGREDLALRMASDDVYDVTAAVRDRINASIVHVEFLETAAGGHVRAFIRRDRDGQLSSQLIARGPVTPADSAAVEALERRARSAVGLATR